jgi:hypothetical protein
MHARLTLVLLLVLVCSVSAQEPRTSGGAQRQAAAAVLPPVSPADAAKAAEVMAFEREMEAAVVRGDVAFLDRICPSDFTFTHGDGWISGGAPLHVDTKETWLAAVSKKPYLTRDLGPVNVEVHGDVAITYGRYKMHQTANPSAPETSVWFERVYAKRNGQWQYLSHRTVHGPLRENDQKPASTK